uniref:Anaerobic ribonucleoside-triphosphate reductase-activating protein n=1 Tax=Prevotella sp. GTC17262 TaxID=3236797 RepID=A0AB33JJ37_9BACT
MISILDIIHDTTVDGPGFRTSVYCAGCPNACPGCHNPQSWDIKRGTPMTTEQIMLEIKQDPFANVTFTGGDPMYQPEGFLELALAIRRETTKTIWCFSGFTFEVLLKNERTHALLEQIDVLVDGPFVQSLHDTGLLFRGSSNQRLIDVRRSLAAGHPVLFDYQPYPLAI